MNSGTNLDFLARQLAESLRSVEDFRLWLDAGVRAIVFDGQPEMSAFDPGRFIIGCQGPNWRHDLSMLLAKLDQRHQLLFRGALRRCLESLRPEQRANDPSRNRGSNGERLALLYLAFAREWKASEVLLALDGLIRTKFPRSDAIYASSLLTWRMLADQDSEIDWRHVFLPFGDFHREPRFKLGHSATIVAGMCLAQPRRAAEYLEWPPFTRYRKLLVQDLSGEKITEYLRTTQLRSAFGGAEPGSADTRPLSDVGMADQLVEGAPSGIRPALTRARHAAPSANLPMPRGLQQPSSPPAGASDQEKTDDS
jgi:hypothetical protein